MPQFDFGNLSSPLPGPQLIDGYLEPWRDALHSFHSGPSRPSYAVPGLMWINNTTNPWVLNVFDGSDDIAIGTIDVATNMFTPSNATPANNSVTNALLADMVQGTIKGRVAGSGTGDPVDLTPAQATAILNTMTGDSGAGGAKGLVPPPAAGDAAANKFLKANGTWSNLTSTFSAYFQSPEQAIAYGSLITQPHGLGAIPKLFKAYLVCKTAEYGYAAGQIVETNITINGGNNFGAHTFVDSTNIYCRVGNAGCIVLNASGQAVGITLANWRIILMATV